MDDLNVTKALNILSKAKLVRDTETEERKLRIRIIKSTALLPVDGATTVRSSYELKMAIRSKRNSEDLVVIPDTGAALTLGNKDFIEKNF